MLQSFFAWCAASADCPWRPVGDPTAALLAQIAAAAATPAPAGGGQVAGAGELYDALLDGLYARSDWPQLGGALAADAAGNGAPVVAMSDHYNQNGSTNGDAAAMAIDCLDHPVSHDLATYGSLADILKASAPVFGPLLAWGEAACAVWPAPPTRPVGPRGRPRRTAHAARRYDERSCNAVCVGGERLARARPRRPAHPGRRRPRGVLLQRVRPRVRGLVSRRRGHAEPGHDLFVVTRVCWWCTKAVAEATAENRRS